MEWEWAKGEEGGVSLLGRAHESVGSNQLHSLFNAPWQTKYHMECADKGETGQIV